MIVPQNKHEYKQKELVCQSIPNLILKPPDTFLLRGYLFIDLSKDIEGQKISKINYYKQIMSQMIDKELRILYNYDQQIHIKQFDSSQTAMLILKRFNLKEAQDASYLLEGYDEQQRKDEIVKLEMKRIASLNIQLKALITQKTLEFENFRRERILQMSQLKKYFIIFDLGFDYSDMQMKAVGFGMNEAFSRLMGCDLQTFQMITVRKGILNFFEGTAKFEMLKYIISCFSTNSQEPLTGTTSIITLDDINVDIKFKIQSLLCQSAEMFKGYFNQDYQQYTYDRKTIFMEIQVSSFQISLINSIRGQAEVNSRMGEQQEIEVISSEYSNIIENLLNDIPYIVQSQDFIDKFYDSKDREVEILNSSKQCGFKNI